MSYPRFSFIVESRAAPQGSKSYVGKGLMIESCKRVKPFRHAVRIAAMNNVPNDWDKSRSMSVNYAFYFARPKSHFSPKGVLLKNAPAHPTGRNIGDIEKLARSVSDALTGVAYDDDSQVVEMELTKAYDTKDLVIVSVYPFD